MNEFRMSLKRWALVSRGMATLVAVLVAWVEFGAQANAEEGRPAPNEFETLVRPFLTQHCLRCHQAEKQTSGIRVDQLTAVPEDRHLKLWEAIRRNLADRTMPPEGEPQPSAADRKRLDGWIERSLHAAKLRPTPKNGGARRLTVAQYRNTLRELLQLDDDFTELLPPDAVSRDGFLNNQETLALSPLLLEAYFDIADQALERCLVDEKMKPVVQHFRVELGAGVNPQPCPDALILGAGSLLLNNADLRVTQPALSKPFAFEPFVMRTKWRFNEGYAGNGTVRGWRDYDSIYHAVFACVRGSRGYPKGHPYDTVPEGLLLRPAITSDEIFVGDGTYGPKANFKISLRELPDFGRFRVTVTAAKYRDGLLLDPGTKAEDAASPEAITVREFGPGKSVLIPREGIYQVDVYPQSPSREQAAPDKSRLDEGLLGAWDFEPETGDSPLGRVSARGANANKLTGRLTADAKLVKSPFGQGVSLDGQDDAVVVPRHESLDVGKGDFTVAAWIHPRELKQAGIVCLGKYSWTHGWYLDMPNKNGVLRIETAGPVSEPNGTVQSPAKSLRVNAWQHVAAVVQRGSNKTRLFINGYPVATGTIGGENLDNPKVDLHIGRIQGANAFNGEIDDVRLYRRALGEDELQALVEPGRRFVSPPPRQSLEEVTLKLGDREFSQKWSQPAFVAVRLPAGACAIDVRKTGPIKPERVVFTPLAETHPLAQRFTVFENRVPRLGVHLGLRRDCGSTLAQVGSPKPVAHTELSRFEFEGAIRNFPSPDVQKENDNYLAGVREIGIRSENTDGRDMPRLLIRSVEFEGPFYDTWPPASHRRIFFESSAPAESSAYAREVIRRFATRAYRRPITSAEESGLMAVFEKSLAGGAGYQKCVQDALVVVLTSPQFVFLIENSDSPAAEPLDDFELASKLSYFLWNGPPDDALLRLAEQGKLRAELDGEVRRLAGDARFDRFLNEFVAQWLALDKFAVLEPDRSRFPKLVRDTRAQLRQEPVRFVRHLFENNLSARQLIDSEFIVANEVVASYYDLGDRTESGLEFVAIPHKRNDLGGVLSQAAILAGLSDGREPNAVKRGAWLARRIVAEPPDDPPPNVPTLKDDPTLTLRQRLERHRNQPGCAQCHAKIDPWGVPFEEFDAGGRFRTESVDARSTLPDKTDVRNFTALRQYLANDRLDQVAFSLLKHLATYATGRTLSYNELERLKRDSAALKAEGYRLRDMLHFVVRSPMFLEK